MQSNINTNTNLNAAGYNPQLSGQAGLNQGLAQPGLLNQGIAQPGLQSGLGLNQGIAQGGLLNQGIAQPGLQSGLGLNQGIAQPGLINQGITGQPITGTFSVAPVTTATITETVYKPVIVEEVVRTDTVVEVQPVITRHIDQTQVNHIQQHVYQPAAAPAQATVTTAAVVNEVLHPHVVNEIQEVIHKEVAVVQVQKVQERIEEHVVLPTQHSNQVVQGPAVTVPGQLPLQAGLAGQGQLPIAGNTALAANQGGLYQGATTNNSGKLEMNRDSSTAQKLENLSAATDLGRHVQAGAADPRNGEPVAVRSNPLSAGLEKAAANAEAKQDRRTANFIA